MRSAAVPLQQRNPLASSRRRKVRLATDGDFPEPYRLWSLLQLQMQSDQIGLSSDGKDPSPQERKCLRQRTPELVVIREDAQFLMCGVCK